MVRIFTGALAFLLAAALAPALPRLPSPASSGDFTYAASGGEATITGYTGKGGAVSVPETIGQNTVTAIGPSAFEGMAAVTSLTLPEGLKEIGAAAFKNCAGLTSVDIPDGVTAVYDDTFRGCVALTSIGMPEGLLGIGQYAFGGCAALASIELPKWLNNISHRAFDGCSKLASVYFYGPPPAVGRGAFSGAPDGLTFYYHLSQTGWAGYRERTSRPFCRMLVETMSGTEPSFAVSGLDDGGKLLAPPKDPQRPGYTFLGWYREAALLRAWDFTKDKVDADVALYAAWKPLPCTISFDSRGGSAVSPVTALQGGIFPPPSPPARAGFGFGGWYREEACVTPWDFFSDTAQGDATLYAAWLLPDDPPAVRAVSSGYRSVTVRWKSTREAEGYEVWFAGEGGKYTLLATVKDLSFRADGLDTNAPYTFRVRSFRQLETEKLYSEYSAAVQARPLPASPKGARAKAAGVYGVDLAWKAVEGAEGYEVWRYDGNKKKYVRVATTRATRYGDDGLAIGTHYIYKIRAYAMVEGKKVYGPFSPSAGAQTESIAG